MTALRDDGYAVVRAVLDIASIRALREGVEVAVASGGEGVDVRAGTVWIRDAASLGEPVRAVVASPAVLATQRHGQSLGPAAAGDHRDLPPRRLMAKRQWWGWLRSALARCRR